MRIKIINNLCNKRIIFKKKKLKMINLVIHFQLKLNLKMIQQNYDDYILFYKKFYIRKNFFLLMFKRKFDMKKYVNNVIFIIINNWIYL